MPASAPDDTADLGLRARQAQVVRDAVLEAVVDLLEAGDLDGIDDISMPDVARAAGVSLRTLYRYFPTRDALLTEAATRVRSRLALPTAVDGPDDIPATFWAASARLAEHPKLARALLRTATGRALHAPNRSVRVEAIHEALSQLTAGLPAARARQVAGVITHLCSSTAWVSISDESHVSAHDARSGVLWALTTLLDAVRVEATTATSSTTRRK
jgi:AcrR family transcriptional regulator